MKAKHLKIATTLIILLAVIFAARYLPGYLALDNAEGSGYTGLPVQSLLSTGNNEGYARAYAVQPFQFPADNGPHPGFKTEWWYYTGNLESSSGRRFGYQLTFFRSAISPDTLSTAASPWRSNQLYMAHFALTDVSDGQFYAFERFSRGAQGLAGAQSQPYRVWLEDWIVSSVAGDQNSEHPVVRVSAAQDNVRLQLELNPAKAIVLQGNGGLSRKSAAPGNASYYFSQTRLQASGSITINGDTFPVTGSSWMDREWSTSVLDSTQVGWDWFSLQTADNQEVMYYQLRDAQGKPDQFSKGVVVNAEAQTRALGSGNTQLQVRKTWTNADGIVYPAGWQLKSAANGMDLQIQPLLNDQELKLTVRYWEGAVRFTGSLRGNPVNGFGYVEMTGYSAPPASE